MCRPLCYPRVIKQYKYHKYKYQLHLPDASEKLETVFKWKERSIIMKEIPGEEADAVADGRGQEKGDSGCRSRGNAGVGRCHDMFCHSSTFQI